jgi:hypothetical protein
VARAYVKWQFVIMKDFSRYPFLFPQLASDSLQNVPFCSGERGLQGHDLLVAVTPSSRQLCLASSHPLPSLLLIQKTRFVGENCIFLVPGPTSTRYTETTPFGFSRFQPAVRHEAGKKSTTGAVKRMKSKEDGSLTATCQVGGYAPNEATSFRFPTEALRVLHITSSSITQIWTSGSGL